MSALAFTDIGSLVTNEPVLGDGSILGQIQDAAIIVADGRVAWVGDRSGLASVVSDFDVSSAPLSLGGRAVIPGFVDSHTHLVFAGDRSAEFEARMTGEPYSAGGIKTSVAATRAAGEASLRGSLNGLVRELHASGITTFESKSGYGLDVATEALSLKLAAEVTTETTFLGAHVVPAEFAGRADDYVDLLAGEMLAACAPHSKWIDVFCDRGAFSVDQAREILTAGVAAGLRPRIHANQLENFGAVQLAVELDCASADHLSHLSDADIEALAGSNTVATFLPGAEFSTRSPYPDAGLVWQAGATVALATDCNPGSSFTTSMAFCIAVAVREMGLSPAQAVWAATAGGAAALRRDDVGRLGVGAQADFVVLNAPNYVHLSYRPGVNLVESTWAAGQKIY